VCASRTILVPVTASPTIPGATAEVSWVNNWQFEVGNVAGVVVIGIVTYLVIRKRR